MTIKKKCPRQATTPSAGKGMLVTDDKIETGTNTEHQHENCSAKLPVFQL
jgi:hypothetical protein